MDYGLYFLDEVKSDIREAKDLYKTQKPGLEKRFAQEIKKSILKLQNHPKSYEIRYKNIRSVFTEVFPYAIHFFIDDKLKQVVIIAILHQSRNQNINQDR
ncbi:type II toxin-antitoxin system RelE/ParE family toxin [Pedobacter sp. Leaf176]|uniref:type II toxin-antitoxin system RelE/ParE family toxin n=1 Tax=Pedobacter sp. Leaf176 TaxID=1736286 RepID=UPI0006F63C0C|nr:type II toxin-antitoxin system RelE/ParE family toxin [Pedobacter sp. Leaf176]KQR72642.1 hypothetical protein ASF92_05050 [Pedobacter sp. Leaf176]